MGKKTTFILFLTVLLVGAYIGLVDRRMPPDDDPDETLVFKTTYEATDFVRFEWGEKVLEFQRFGKQWTLEAPAKLQADQGALDRIGHTLADLRRIERITRKQRDEHSLDVAHYGFIPPRGRLILGDKRNPSTWLLGRDAPLGDDVYVKKENEEDILRVSRQVIDLLNTGLENLLDRTLLYGASEEVYQVNLKNQSGFIQVQRDETGPWKMLQPSPGRADQGGVAGLVDALLNARVEKFVEASVVDSALYGLNPAETEVTFMTRGSEEATQTLLLGKPHTEDERLVYAMLDGADSIVAVGTGLVARLDMEAVDLRDRRLVTFPAQDIRRIRLKQEDRVVEVEASDDGLWRVVSPVQWDANQELVNQLLRDWTTANIEAFLPEAVAAETNQPPVVPEWSIEFIRTGASGDPEVMAVDVYPLAESNKLAEVQVQGDVLSSLVSRDLMEAISVNPLTWRDRVVLALSRGDIVRVSVVRDGVETAVEWKEDRFVAVGNDKAEVDKQVLDAMLEQVESLQVWAYLLEEDPNAQDLGLKEPNVVLTFGLRGEVGINKSLLIGGPGPAGGRYAQIRGQDVVFLLDQGTVNPLTRDLWQTPALPSEAPVEAKP